MSQYNWTDYDRNCVGPPGRLSKRSHPQNYGLSMSSQEYSKSNVGAMINNNVSMQNLIEGVHPNSLCPIDYTGRDGNIPITNSGSRKRYKRRSGTIIDKKIVNENENNQDIAGDISDGSDLNNIKTANYSGMVGDACQDSLYTNLPSKTFINPIQTEIPRIPPNILGYQIDSTNNNNRIKSVNSSGTSFINCSQMYPMLVSSATGQPFIIGSSNRNIDPIIQTNNNIRNAAKNIKSQNIAFAHPVFVSEFDTPKEEDQIASNSRKFVTKTSNYHTLSQVHPNTFNQPDLDIYTEIKNQNEFGSIDSNFPREDVNQTSNLSGYGTSNFPLTVNDNFKPYMANPSIVNTKIPMQLIPISQNPMFLNNFNIRNISTYPQLCFTQIPTNFVHNVVSDPLNKTMKSPPLIPTSIEQKIKHVPNYEVPDTYVVPHSDLYDNNNRYLNTKTDSFVANTEQYSSNNELNNKTDDMSQIPFSLDNANQDSEFPVSENISRTQNDNPIVYYAKTNLTNDPIEHSSIPKVTKKGKFTVKSIPDSIPLSFMPKTERSDSIPTSENLQNEFDENRKPKSRFKKTRIREKIERWCMDGFSALDFRFTLIPDKILELSANKPDYILKESNFIQCENCNEEDHQYYKQELDYHNKEFRFWNRGERVALFGTSDENDKNFCSFHSKFLKLANQSESLSCVTASTEQPTPSNSPRRMTLVNTIPNMLHTLSPSWQLTTLINSEAQYYPGSADYITSPVSPTERNLLQNQQQHSPRTAMLMVEYKAPLILSGTPIFNESIDKMSQKSPIQTLGDEHINVFAHPVLMSASSPSPITRPDQMTTYVAGTMMGRFEESFSDIKPQYPFLNPTILQSPIGSSPTLTQQSPAPQLYNVNHVTPHLIYPLHQQATPLTSNTVIASSQSSNNTQFSFIPLQSTSSSNNLISNVSQVTNSDNLNISTDYVNIIDSAEMINKECNPQIINLNEINDINDDFNNRILHSKDNFIGLSQSFSDELDRSLKQFKIGLQQLFLCECQSMQREMRGLVTTNERLKNDLNKVRERVDYLEVILKKRTRTSVSSTLPESTKIFDQDISSKDEIINTNNNQSLYPLDIINSSLNIISTSSIPLTSSLTSVNDMNESL